MQLQAMSSDTDDDISLMGSEPTSPHGPQPLSQEQFKLPPAVHLPSGLIIQPPSPGSRPRPAGSRAETPKAASSPRHSGPGERSRPQSPGRLPPPATTSSTPATPLIASQQSPPASLSAAPADQPTEHQQQSAAEAHKAAAAAPVRYNTAADTNVRHL